MYVPAAEPVERPSLDLIPRNVTEIFASVSQKCQPLADTLYLHVAVFYNTKQKRRNVPELCRNLTK